MSRPISVRYTYLALALLLLGIVISILSGYSVFWGLLSANIVVYIILYFHDYSPKQIFSMIISGVISARTVLLIMSIIGLIIGLWMASGTIPTMMSIGFKYLSKINFLLAAFLITSLISMVLGTSIGTLSTVGMALVGIGKGLGIPLPLLVGTLVSGSYVGDRTSPMSSSANLTAIITKTKLLTNLRHMVTTIGPVYIICSLFYFWIGKAYLPKNSYLLESEINKIQILLVNSFNIDYMNLLPPIIILGLAVLKFPMAKSLTIGLFSTILVIIYQGENSILEVIQTAIFGFYPIEKEIASILKGGGLISMKNILLIIITSTALNGMFDKSEMVNPLMERFIARTKSIGNLIFKTAFLSISIATVTCNQTLAVIIPGKFLQSSFEKFNVSKNTLARTIADTGIVVVPLIPWNVNAIVISTIFGVSAIQFAPYALLCYLMPIITVIFGYTGMIMTKHTDNRSDKSNKVIVHE